MIERTIIMQVKAPEECTEAEFIEWVEFCTNYRCDMKRSNPLEVYDIEPSYLEVRRVSPTGDRRE